MNVYASHQGPAPEQQSQDEPPDTVRRHQHGRGPVPAAEAGTTAGGPRLSRRRLSGRPRRRQGRHRAPSKERRRALSLVRSPATTPARVRLTALPRVCWSVGEKARRRSSRPPRRPPSNSSRSSRRSSPPSSRWTTSRRRSASAWKPRATWSSTGSGESTNSGRSRAGSWRGLLRGGTKATPEIPPAGGFQAGFGHRGVRPPPARN